MNALLVWSGLNGPQGIAVTGNAPAVNGVWTNGSTGNWTSGGNWSGGNVPGINGPSQSANDTATFATPATSGSSVTVNLDTSTQLSAITFSSTSSYCLQAGGGTLTLSATAGLAIVTVSAGSQTIALPLIIGGSADFAPASGTQLTIMSEITGIGAISLTDAGTLVLSGTNTYGGGTIVEAGRMVVNSPTALPPGGSLSVGPDADFMFASVAAAPQAGGAPALAPEPSTLALLGVGAVVAAGFAWRMRLYRVTW